MGEHNISTRPDHEELAKKYLEVKNLKEVAKLCGCSTPTVRNACLERNIPIEKSTAQKSISEQEHIYNTYKQTKNKLKTAKLCNCSNQYVYKIIEKFETKTGIV